MYRQGRENTVADALSRKLHEEILMVSTITACQPYWLADVVTSYQTDEEAQKLQTALTNDPTSHPDFTLEGNLIRRKGKVWLGTSTQLLFMAAHWEVILGHLSLTRGSNSCSIGQV